MKGYMKLTAALAAFALLVVVMGLGTSNTVQAQTGTITATPEYVCSLSSCSDTNTSAIGITNIDSGTFEVLNLDVARVSGGINPRTITIEDTTTEITFVQEFTDVTENAGAGDGNPDIDTEIRAFNGNRVQIKYEPANTNTFATFKTITVDNVKPTLIINSPTEPLVVKGNTDITFSADITDGGSGYTKTNTPTSGINQMTGSPGVLEADPEAAGDAANGTTAVGGVRLVVAGNVVALANTNFTAVDGGWNVWATINSTAIQAIGANTPWYFETRDRAGNSRRTSGTIALKNVSVSGSAVTDGRFAGNLQDNSFSGSSMKITRGSNNVTLPISEFNADDDDPATTDGMFTLGTRTIGTEMTPRGPTNLFGGNEAIAATDKYEIVGSSLVTVDSEAPSGPVATTGVAYSSSAKDSVRGLKGKANSIEIMFNDDGKDEDDGAGSGLSASSVTPAAFTVSGNAVSSVQVVDNAIYLTLAENLGPDEKPDINIVSGSITDKAGNAYGGGRVKAGDGLGPNLSLSESGDLSKEKVTVTITTDEQLGSLPIVRLSRVINSDGDVVTDGDQECVYAAVDAGDSALEPALPAVTQALEDDGTCEAPGGADGLDIRYGGTAPTPSDVAGQPASSPDPSQTAALSYTYGVTADTANPVGSNGGKYNVYVTGVDTQNTLNISSVGHASDANHSAAFTFQLDEALNGGDNPTVTVSDKTAASGDADVPEVEAVDPMIVTVDWAGESGEYPGDSYRTVTLTSAVLVVSFTDGSSETTTFDLTTDVSSADWIKYTIPILNPKVGSYTLTVKGEDSAGNASGTAGHVSKWNVIAAKPVSINLEPGWNLISLPFQPGNPAINSVIPSTHPVDIVMTYNNASQVWMVSRRDAESGLFVGDISVMTANTAYFVRTDKFQAIRLLRPALATAAAAPPPPPAIAVVEGWNLVPVVSNDIPTPKTIDADLYFGTLGDKGWLKALTFNTLLRTWDSVSPGTPTGEDPETVMVGKGYWLYATSAGVIIP